MGSFGGPTVTWSDTPVSTCRCSFSPASPPSQIRSWMGGTTFSPGTWKWTVAAVTVTVTVTVTVAVTVIVIVAMGRVIAGTVRTVAFITVRAVEARTEEARGEGGEAVRHLSGETQWGRFKCLCGLGCASPHHTVAAVAGRRQRQGRGWEQG